MKTEPLFNLEHDKSKSATIDTSGVVVYFELFQQIKLYHYLSDKFKDYHPQQGWDAACIIITIILLNLLGYNCISDVYELAADEGFVLLFRQYLEKAMTSSEWRHWNRRFNNRCNHTLPSPTVIKDFLSSCHDDKTMTGIKGTAKIHKPSSQLDKLLDALEFTQNQVYNQFSLPELTLDQDGTVVKTYKKKALFSYLNFKAYQPINIYCPELDTVMGTEFRDGNVPAKMSLLQMLQRCVQALPTAIETIYYRGDSASFQYDFLKSMNAGNLVEGRGVVYFAVSALINPTIKKLYDDIKEKDWKTYNTKTKQEYVEVEYYEDWMGTLKPLRLCFIRTKQKGQVEKMLEKKSVDPDYTQLCLDLYQDDGVNVNDSFDSQNSEYTIRAIVSNIPDSKYTSTELIKWARNRCGKSEELHSIQKEDLAAGKLPSGKFGANYAWWVIANIAFNLHSLLKAIALPKEFKTSRFKTIRSKILNCAGKISKASRYFKVRIANEVKLNRINEIIDNLIRRYIPLTTS